MNSPMNPRALLLMGSVATSLFALDAAAAGTATSVHQKIPICDIAHAALETKCAPTFLADVVVPPLFPLKITGLHFDPKEDKPDDKVDTEFDLDLTIDKFAINPEGTKKKDLGIEMHATVLLHKVKTKETSDGKETVIDKYIRISLESEVGLTTSVLPSNQDCRAKKVDWSAIMLDFTIDKLKKVKIEHVDEKGNKAPGLTIKIPSFLTNNKILLGVLNLVLKKKAFRTLGGYPQRGLPICITTDSNRHPNCPIPPPPKPAQAQENLRITFGAGNTDMLLDLSHPPAGVEKKTVSVGNAIPLCAAVTKVANDECTGILANRVAGAIVPFAAEVPEKALGVKGIKVIAKELGISTGPSGIKAATKVAISNGSSEEFIIEAAGGAKVSPKCDHQSFSLGIEPSLQRFTTSPKIPAWLLDGVVRTVVNQRLAAKGGINVPLKPKALKGTSAELRVCSLVDRMTNTSAAGEVANAITQSILPLDLRGADIAAAASKNSASTKALLGDVLDTITVRIAEIATTTGKGDESISVAVELLKAGETEVLKTSATLLVGNQVDCTKGKEHIVINLKLDKVSASELPKWLRETSLLMLINNALGGVKPPCLLGTCPTE